MHLTKMRSVGLLLALATSASLPLAAQSDVKSIVLKHLKISRDFTLKVAAQMPESTYDFKLTPPQMSFAEQMVHLAQSLSVFVSPLAGEQPNASKPASLKKKDVIAFIGTSFDGAIERVSKLTNDQIMKTYNSEEGSMTGLELLMGMLDHTTHHRASAEMYLRAKGITPAEYQF